MDRARQIERLRSDPEEVGGKPLIVWHLAKLAAAGFKAVEAWFPELHLKDGEDLAGHFGFDMSLCWPFNMVADLDFQPVVVEETEDTVLKRDGNGALLRRHKLHDTTPEHVDFLVKDEQGRVFLTSMVACLFARGVYSDALLAECLRSVGYTTLAENIAAVSSSIQKLRWKTRLATGFDPQAVTIPKRFTEITTWKGKIDEGYLGALKEEYARRILELGKEEKV